MQIDEIDEEGISTKSGRAVFLAKAAVIVMIGTLVARLSGYGREVVTAFFFGAKTEVDAFKVGILLPNLLRTLLADAAIGSAFIPVFASYLAKGEEEDAWEAGNSIITIATLVLTLVVALGILFAPQLVSILAPGFAKHSQKFALTVQLTRIMFPCILFMSLAGLIMGVLHSYDHFAAPAFAPLFYNLVFVGFVIIFAHRLGPVSLAVGITLGALTQFLFQLPFLRKAVGSKKLAFRFNWRHPGVKQMAALVVPIIIASATTDINVVVDTRFASLLRTGSIAAISYAQRIYLLPQGLFAFAIAMVLFPTLVKQAARGETKKLKESFSLGTRVMWFVLFPAGIGLMVLCVPIVGLILRHGRFTQWDNFMTSSALFYLAASACVAGELQLVLRVYYALKDMVTPLIVAVGAIIVNYAGDWFLMNYLPVFAKWVGLPKSLFWMGLPHGGIVLSTTIVTYFNFFILIEILRRRLGGIDGKKMAVSFVKTGVASAGLGVAAFFSWKGLASVFGQSLKGQVISLGSGILAGILAFLLIAFALRQEELHLTRDLVVTRFLKKKAAGSKAND